MGFFSWMTSDTNKSIANQHSSRPTFTVHMITEDGRVFTEESYDGYGIFGGKDFYELVAELNGATTRSEGIDITFKDNPSGDYNGNFKSVKLVEHLNTHVPRGDNEQWKSYWLGLPYPESCPHQGFFYPNEDEEDECVICGNSLESGWCNSCEEEQ